MPIREHILYWSAYPLHTTCGMYVPAMLESLKKNIVLLYLAYIFFIILYCYDRAFKIENPLHFSLNVHLQSLTLH